MAFDTLHLEKGMYREAGKSFSQVLEALDPSESYKGTALEGTDAFQRQLKRFGIRVKGAGSDPVEKFFSTFESAVLFPEFVARVVRQGLNALRPGRIFWWQEPPFSTAATIAASTPCPRKRNAPCTTLQRARPSPRPPCARGKLWCTCRSAAEC